MISALQNKIRITPYTQLLLSKRSRDLTRLTHTWTWTPWACWYVDVGRK